MLGARIHLCAQVVDADGFLWRARSRAVAHFVSAAQGERKRANFAGERNLLAILWRNFDGDGPRHLRIVVRFTGGLIDCEHPHIGDQQVRLHVGVAAIIAAVFLARQQHVHKISRQHKARDADNIVVLEADMRQLQSDPARLKSYWRDLQEKLTGRAGIVDTLQRTPADLLVLSLADRAGVPDLFQDSVAEEVARAARIPSLCVRRGGGGFVSEETGEVTLRSILIPVAPHIACARAVDVVMSLCEQLGCDAPEIHLMRVGSALEPPERAPPRARFQLHAANGPVVEAILDLQAKTGADLVCMPVNRSRGFVAAVRGKIAERVLRSAPCPTLLTPAD